MQKFERCEPVVESSKMEGSVNSPTDTFLSKK